MKKLSDVYFLACASNTADIYKIDNKPDYVESNNIIWFAENIYMYLESMFQEKLRINSWFRNKELNTKVGGSPTSRHLEGMAIDFTVEGENVRHVAMNIFMAIPSFGKMIIYPNHNFIHLDSKFTNEKLIYVTYDKKNYERISYDDIYEIL